MTEGGILRHIILFSIPLILGNLFQFMYNMVDTWVVGNFVSDEAFSAVGSLGTVTNLIINFFSGFASGTGVIIAQQFGAGKHDDMKRSAHTAATLTLGLCVVFTVLSLALISPIMSILKMPEDVAPHAVSYLTIWFSGISFLMIYNMGAAMMRAIGDSRRPFIFLVVCAVLNTVLDLLFVLVFDMDVKGVALATVIAQAVSSALIVIALLKTDTPIRLRVRDLRFDFGIFKKIFRLAMPAAFQGTLISFSNLFVHSYVNYFGKGCMGGYTAYNKIDQVILLPVQSIAAATTTFVGQNLGKGQLKRAERAVRISILISFGITLVLMTPVMLLTEHFVRFFNDDAEIVKYGVQIIRLLTPFYVVVCVSQVYGGALRGAGVSTLHMFSSLCSLVAVRQIYLFIVTRYVANTFLLVLAGFPLGWILNSLIIFSYYKIKGLRVYEKSALI